MQCIEGLCEKCKLTDERHRPYEWNKRASYYIFEKKMEEYFNKSGEKKSYECITRVDYHNVPLMEL